MSHSYLGVDLAAASLFFLAAQSVEAYGAQLHLLATEKGWILWATGDLSERLFLENTEGWRCVAGLVKVCIWLKEKRLHHRHEQSACRSAHSSELAVGQHHAALCNSYVLYLLVHFCTYPCCSLALAF